MGCLLVLKASKNRRSKGKNPPWCLISANPPKCGDAGGLHRLLPVRAPKGVGGEGGNRTRGLPHPQSAKNASPRGWQKLPNGGDASPTRGFERGQSWAISPIIGLGGWPRVGSWGLVMCCGEDPTRKGLARNWQLFALCRRVECRRPPRAGRDKPTWQTVQPLADGAVSATGR